MGTTVPAHLLDDYAELVGMKEQLAGDMLAGPFQMNMELNLLLILVAIAALVTIHMGVGGLRDWTRERRMGIAVVIVVVVALALFASVTMADAELVAREAELDRLYEEFWDEVEWYYMNHPHP